MISVIKGDILTLLDREQPCSPTIIAQGCNAQGKMRSGFAKVLRDLDEEVYKTYKKSGHQLGTVSYYEIKPNVYIANCITQEFYGYDGLKYTSYDAVHECFIKVNDFISTLGEDSLLAFPMIGAVFGGGNNNVIKTIIDEVVVNTNFKFQFIR